MTRRIGLIGLALGLLGAPAEAQHVEHLDSLLVRLRLAPLAPATPTLSPWAQRAAVARQQGRAVSGVLSTMIVPALFSDSPAPETAPDHIQQLFFGAGNPTSLTAFYEEASGNALRVHGAAAPWSRTSVTLADGTGGSASALGIGPAFGDYLLQAIAAADASLDFRAFDNDGPDGVPDSGDDDGQVDALVFMFAEVARSCGGPGVWPHKSGLAGRNGGVPWASADTGIAGRPITANPYVIVSAVDCDGQPVSRVATIAHELGHELGQPDIYHVVGTDLTAILPENRRWVLGCFDLMAGGAWSCGPADQRPPFGPTHFSPWTRERLGWIVLERVGDVRYREFELAPVQSSRRALEVLLDDAGRESLLIEYRPALGFDRDLPASGVLIYRHDRAASLRPDPAGPRHYRIGLLEADGDSTLVRAHWEGGNRGTASDMFAVDGAVTRLSNVTTPSTRRADGEPSTVTIHSIAVVGGTAKVVISTAATPLAVRAGPPDTLVAGEPVALELPIGGGALPYAATVVAGSPPGVTVRSESDRLRLEGSALATGLFDVQVRLTDARQSAATSTIPVVVTFPLIADGDLMAGLVRGERLTATQRQVLDNDGNRNGRLDVGDARAYLRRVRAPSPP